MSFEKGNVLSGKAGVIFAELEYRFVSGKYKFGERLSINSLAEEFQASRQPVSTAVNHLRSVGYVRIIPQVGCLVVSPEKQAISDFFLMLAKAESAVASLATDRWQAEDIDQLQKLALETKSIAFDSIEHRDAYASAVVAYHNKIHNMACSIAIATWLEQLWKLADFYLWQGAEVNFSPTKVALANQERQEIVLAIKNRDTLKVVELVEAHVRAKPLRVGVV
jgi:DNA-binding GntR family transcriptional regulator